MELLHHYQYSSSPQDAFGGVKAWSAALVGVAVGLHLVHPLIRTFSNALLQTQATLDSSNPRNRSSPLLRRSFLHSASSTVWGTMSKMLGSTMEPSQRFTIGHQVDEQINPGANKRADLQQK